MGPWKVYKTEGGSSGPLRGEKGTTWEGGQRVPCIVRWPSRVPAGTLQRQVVTNMDLLPTIATLCNAKLPKRKIDGRDVSSILLDTQQELHSKPFLYYSSQGELEGIRDGKYKLLTIKEGNFLFDVESDISEAYNLADKMPEKVRTLKEKMKKLDAALTSEKRKIGSLKP